VGPMEIVEKTSRKRIESRGGGRDSDGGGESLFPTKKYARINEGGIIKHKYGEAESSDWVKWTACWAPEDEIIRKKSERCKTGGDGSVLLQHRDVGKRLKGGKG